MAPLMPFEEQSDDEPIMEMAQSLFVAPENFRDDELEDELINLGALYDVERTSLTITSSRKRMQRPSWPTGVK